VEPYGGHCREASARLVNMSLPVSDRPAFASGSSPPARGPAVRGLAETSGRTLAVRIWEGTWVRDLDSGASGTAGMEVLVSLSQFLGRKMG